MKDEINKFKTEILLQLETAKIYNDISIIKQKINKKISQIKQIIIKSPLEEKRIYGPLLMEMDKDLRSKILTVEQKMKEKKIVDFSLPVYFEKTVKHPIHVICNKIRKLLIGWGFQEIQTSELETTERCFDKLNIEANHPARNNFQSIFISLNKVLRPHTTATDTYLLHNPGKYFTLGKVYRRDHFDSTHSPMFHQLEVLVVDEKVNFMDLNQFISNFLFNFFEKTIDFRLRMSYFPFTEPSLECDINKRKLLYEDYLMDFNKSKETNEAEEIYYKDEWIEVLGAGMLHPKVFESCGAKITNAYALGMGIERLCMLMFPKYLKDLRHFYEIDISVLRDFASLWNIL